MLRAVPHPPARRLLALLIPALAIACARRSDTANPATPARPRRPASLHALIAAAPARLRAVLQALTAAGAPTAGPLAWITTVPLPL